MCEAVQGSYLPKIQPNLQNHRIVELNVPERFIAPSQKYVLFVASFTGFTMKSEQDRFCIVLYPSL